MWLAGSHTARTVPLPVLRPWKGQVIAPLHVSRVLQGSGCSVLMHWGSLGQFGGAARCGLRGEEPTVLLEQKSPSPCSCRVSTLLLGVSGSCWPFHSSLPQREHVAVIYVSKKLPVQGASSPVRQAPKQPFHGLLVPPQTIPATPGAHGLCSTPWKAALVLAELMLPPGEPLSSSPRAQGASLVAVFLTETSYHRHPGMMKQLQASADMWWSQEPCKPTATFRGTSSTKAAGKFFEGHPSTFCPCLLDHEGRRVCGAAQGSGSAPQAGRGMVMEELCCGGLLPPGHLCLLGTSTLLLEREEVEGGKSQSARAVSELISAGPTHPCGTCGLGGQC